MNGNKRDTSTTWVDPDDAPELTDEFFKQADLLKGDKVVKRGRGRPRGTTKPATTVRLDDDVLEAMNCESPFDLLGLFQGVGLAQASATPVTGTFPNMIWLYRRPILDYWAEHEETLGDLVTHVLVHEIGHHFGLSDDDMEAIEAAAG